MKRGHKHEGEAAWVHDRKKEPVTTDLFDTLPEQGFRYAIFVPAPPFATGQCVAIATGDNDAHAKRNAERIVEAIVLLTTQQMAERNDYG